MSQPTERQLIESWAHDACMNPFCSGGCPERFPAERTILQIKEKAFREGLFAALLDDGFTPEYAENRDQELNPYQGTPRD